MKFFKYIIIFYIFFVTVHVNSDIVSQVKIIGNKRISNDTIIDIIDFNKTKDYSNSDLNTFQRQLFETNFFSKVNLNLSNNTLEITVTENPLVEFFFIKGEKNNTRLDLVYNSVSLGQNKIYSEYLLNKDIETIKEIYNNEGYFDISILPEVLKLPNGNVNIVLNISEINKYKIKRIFFIGDKYFKSSSLLNVISSSEHGWWKFLSSSSTANQNRIDFDKQLLKSFYLNNGFYDAQILSSDINFLNSKSVNLTYSINSGQKYKFLNFEILDDQKHLNKKDYEVISGFVANEAKGDFSLNKINNIRQKVYTYLNLNKIEFVKFSILENKIENNKISLKIVFNKTARNFVNKINIKGNSITEEEVIRRELSFSEGDTFSNYKLEKSQDNLKASGIFKEVKAKITNLENDKLDVDFEVIEQPTGTISAGVGVGSSGSEVTTGINEKNLFGKGINLNSNFSLGTEKIKGNISTIVPDFKNSDNDFIYNVYLISTDYENTGYESSVIGNSVATRYDLLNDVTFSPGFGIENDSINTNSGASQLYQNREGDYLTFKTFYNLVTDKRDKRFQTTKGYRLNFGQTLATPGSDIPFLKNNLKATYYYPLNQDYILSVKSGINSINSLNNEDIKLSDRQFLSNKVLRGFENFGVGPKDGEDHVGGNYSAYSSIASTIPNLLPEKWNAQSLIFVDAGNVWGVDYDSSKDSNKIRSSIGIGLDWTSPLGPLSFVFAQPLSKAEGDIEENFSFQIGSSF